jgi:tripartite-type tricarboxylate transporter receptor subunit TctC
MHITIAGLAVLLLGPWMTAPAAAQSFPSRQITLIVPYPPGGVVDMTARVLADGLKDKFKQTVVVVNRAGANGVIGAQELMRSPPDGYTLLLNNDGGIAIPPAVDPNFKLDPLKDLDTVANVVEYGHVFIANKALPVNSMQEFIAYARSRPGELNYGTAGVGTLAHLAMELFGQRTGIKMTHVPYKGASPALNDLIGGTLSVNVQSVPTAMGQFGSDRMKVLAVLGEQRMAALPDVPTLQESGLPGFVVTSWLGVFGPRGMPAEIKATLSDALLEIVKTPAVRDRFRAIGFETSASGPAEFEKFLAAEVARWKKVAADNGISAAQ